MAIGDTTWEPEDGLHSPSRKGRVTRVLVPPLFLLMAALLVVGYQRTRTPVTLVVDGVLRRVQTHQTTVGAVLREAGLTVYPEDNVVPDLSASLIAGTTVAVRRARPVLVDVDGRRIEARTQLTQTRDILKALDVQMGQHDVVDARTEPPEDSGRPAPLHIHVDRAVPVTLQEAGSPPSHFFTTARTVGEALHDAGIVLYLADDVRPSLSSPIQPGTLIFIKRSVPAVIYVDGRTLRTRTHRFIVGDVLADMNVSLQGLDYVVPDLSAPLGDGQEIRVVRVREELLVQQEMIPFETQWAPDPELPLDSPHQVGQEGRPGVFERRIRVRYEDGVEVDRWVEAEWVARTPQPKILNYGTKVVLYNLDTPSGPVQYWRKYRMLATSYNAASSGKAPDHPRYGITRLGWKMRHGIVAVDPRVINLGSRVYVPGYGVGDAADTGGAIVGLRIDLGYDDDNLVSWYRCVDVYLLGPPPQDIDYIVTSLVHPRCR